MFSAKKILGFCTVTLIVAAVAFGLTAFGVAIFRPITIVAVASGAIGVAIGFVCNLTGYLKNDLND